MEVEEIIRQGASYYEMLRGQESVISGPEQLLFEACAALKRLNKTMTALLHIKQAAEGATSLFSNQGQAMDGFSELANYQQILRDFVMDK